MRISNSRPTYRTQRMAQCALDHILDYFKVQCRLLQVPDGWQVLPPQTLGAVQSDAIENFMVAYGCGWEDRGVLAREGHVSGSREGN